MVDRWRKRPPLTGARRSSFLGHGHQMLSFFHYFKVEDCTLILADVIVVNLCVDLNGGGFTWDRL